MRHPTLSVPVLQIPAFRFAHAARLAEAAAALRRIAARLRHEPALPRSFAAQGLESLSPSLAQEQRMGLGRGE